MSDLNDSFVKESEKLDNQISELSAKLEKLSISEIVSAYYQVMNVSSILQILKDSGEREKTHSTEEIIQKKFNDSLHPEILSQLNESIQEYMDKLNANKGKRSSETIQNESKLYEELRELMSTKEFAEQYGKGLIK